MNDEVDISLSGNFSAKYLRERSLLYFRAYLISVNEWLEPHKHRGNVDRLHEFKIT